MSYNSDLQSNNDDLQTILNIVNTLPDADDSGSVTLPELGDTAAKPTDIAAGKVLYDDEGNPVTGTVTTINEDSSTNASYYTMFTNSSNDIPVSLGIKGKVTAPVLLRSGAYVTITSNLSNFGNASDEDVVDSKTFTSSAGRKVTGKVRELSNDYWVDEEDGVTGELYGENQVRANFTMSDNSIVRRGSTMQFRFPLSHLGLSNSSPGGLVYKSGKVVDNTVIETGLSSVSFFILYRTSISAQGLLHAMKDVTAQVNAATYCSSYSSYFKTYSSSTTEMITMDGGTVTFTASGSANMISGLEYMWVAFGLE